MGKARTKSGGKGAGGRKTSSQHQHGAHQATNKKPNKKQPPMKRDRAAAIKAELRAQNTKPKPAVVAKPEEHDEESDIGEDDLAFMNEHKDFAMGFLGSMQDESALRMVGKRHQTPKEKRERRVRPRTEEARPSSTTPLPPSIPSHARRKDDEVDEIRKASTSGWEAKANNSSKRLPIKTIDGKVLHPDEEESDNQRGDQKEQDESSGGEVEDEEVEDSEAEDSNDEEDETGEFQDDHEEGADGPTEGTGELDLNLCQAARLEQKKVEIASLCEEILENPEDALMKATGAAVGGKNQTRVQRLLGLLHDDDKAVQQLVLLSLLAVFRDIIPSYRIRLPTETELSQKVSKEVKRVREFERAMLGSYQAYLKHLESLVKQRSRGASSGPPSPLPRLALRCLCELLTAHPHFNFTSNILACLVKQGSCRGRTAEAIAFRKASCQAIRRLFDKDIQGDTSLTAVRLISKEVKGKMQGGKSVEGVELMQTLQSLRLRVHEDDVKSAKSRAIKEMKRAKHLKQKGDDIEASLKEAEGRIDPVLKAKFQAESLEEITLAYFRVLKQKPPDARLLPVALEGLARFAHLINLDTVQDVVGVLKDLLSQKQALPPLSALNCVLTGLRTLQGPGRELRVDDKELITALYAQLGRARSRATLALACTCVRAALIDRREYSLARVAAFYKRLLGMSLSVESREAQALLILAKELSVVYPGVDAMLEGEHERVSTGVYKPDCLEPELCNALACGAWELSLLSKHFHPQVKASVRLAKQGSKVTEKAVKSQKEAGSELLRQSDEEALRLQNLFFRIPKPNPLHNLLSKQSQGSANKPRNVFIRKQKGPCTLKGMDEDLLMVDGKAACRLFYKRTVKHRRKLELSREYQGLRRALALYQKHKE